MSPSIRFRSRPGAGASALVSTRPSSSSRTRLSRAQTCSTRSRVEQDATSAGLAHLSSRRPAPSALRWLGSTSTTRRFARRSRPRPRANITVGTSSRALWLTTSSGEPVEPIRRRTDLSQRLSTPRTRGRRCAWRRHEQATLTQELARRQPSTADRRDPAARHLDNASPVHARPRARSLETLAVQRVSSRARRRHRPTKSRLLVAATARRSTRGQLDTQGRPRRCGGRRDAGENASSRPARIIPCVPVQPQGSRAPTGMPISRRPLARPSPGRQG